MDFFFKLNLRPPYSLRSQGIRNSCTVSLIEKERKMPCQVSYKLERLGKMHQLDSAAEKWVFYLSGHIFFSALSTNIILCRSHNLFLLNILAEYLDCHKAQWVIPFLTDQVILFCWTKSPFPFFIVFSYSDMLC